MATFNLVLDGRKKLENDKFHLVVRLSHKSDILYLRLGVLMTKKDYESIFCKKSFDLKANNLKTGFQKYLKRAQKIFPLIEPFNPTEFRQMFYDKSFDPDNKSENDIEDFEKGDITALYEYTIKTKLSNGQLGETTVDLYRYYLRTLLKFKPDLKYEDVTPDFLSRLEVWFLSKHIQGKENSLATFGSLCRNLRAVINHNIQKKNIPASYEYPFRDFKIPNFTPPKLVISNDEIQKIIDCGEFNDFWEEYSRDIWLMLYRLNGINFIDLLKLRWDDIKGGYLIFYRHKTKTTRRNNIRPIRVKINEKIQSLIDKLGKRDSPFLIGLINDNEYDATYLKNRNQKLKVKINRYLKKVGERLNLSMSLDISLARDAYANTLKRANINPLKISENMNHSDPRTTTQHYLDAFEQDDLDEVNEVVL